MAEVNTNWLAEQVEGSEEYRQAQAEIARHLATIDKKDAELRKIERENAALREAMHNLRLAVRDAIGDVRLIAQNFGASIVDSNP